MSRCALMPTVHANLLQMLHLREGKPLTFPLPYVWYMHVCAGIHACLYVCRGQRANGWVSIFLLLSVCLWYVHMEEVSVEARRERWVAGAGVTGSCELWYRCWQGHQVFLAAELWSQLYSFDILRWISHWIWRSSTVASQQASEILLSLYLPKHRDLKTRAAIPGWGSAHSYTRLGISTQVLMLLTQ